MRTSLSFLGFEVSQLPVPGEYGNTGVEAILLNEKHLEGDEWSETWANLSLAVNLYGRENVTFHFPMNACDYVAEPAIEQKLRETYVRAGQLGIAGIVVHSNRIREVPEWKKFNPVGERNRIFEVLASIKQIDPALETWIGLENMPLVGNFGLETDPLFVSGDDFKGLPQELGIVWDVCHALSSYQYINALLGGRVPSSIFARMVIASELAPTNVMSRICHWHFAGSSGLNNPDRQETCKEGVLPSEADLPTSYFEDMLRTILLGGGDTAINFEVQENDYTSRSNGPAIIEWAKRIHGSL